jgi:hypothetical protein
MAVVAATLAAPALAALVLAGIGVAGAGQESGLGPLSGTKGLEGSTPAPAIAPPPASEARERPGSKRDSGKRQARSARDRDPERPTHVPTRRSRQLPNAGLNRPKRDSGPAYAPYDPTGPGSATGSEQATPPSQALDSTGSSGSSGGTDGSQGSGNGGD